MAKPTFQVIQALRDTAKRINNSPDYQWGHMGSCNCGFLAQDTSLTKKEIHAMAMEGYGDWNEQLNDYCPSSRLRMDHLISDLVAFGFDTTDLSHLEKLSDPKVLHSLPVDKRNLTHNKKADVILYLNTLAQKLEEKLLDKIEITCVGEE